MSTLAQYIRARGGKPTAEMAETLGVSRTSLYDLASGRRRPDVETILRIERATDGEVDAASWPHLQGLVESIRATLEEPS